MDIKLQEIMNPDEKLLWSGKTEAFDTLDLTHKKSFVTKAIVMVVSFIALVAVYFSYIGSNGIEAKPVFVLIVGALMAVPVLGMFQDAKKLRGAIYAVTDKRLIAIVDGIRTVDLASVNQAQFKTDEDGHTSLLLGKNGIKARSPRWRYLSVSSPDVDEATGLCMKFGFYAVEDHAKLKEVLKSFLPV